MAHSKLTTFAEFDAALAAARVEIDALAIEIPGDPAIRSVQLQLEALHGWTRDGRKPTQGEKDRLNFGAIASRELDTFPVAGSLYQLASYVIWWA